MALSDKLTSRTLAPTVQLRIPPKAQAENRDIQALNTRRREDIRRLEQNAERKRALEAESAEKGRRVAQLTTDLVSAQIDGDDRWHSALSAARTEAMTAQAAADDLYRQAELAETGLQRRVLTTTRELAGEKLRLNKAADAVRQMVRAEFREHWRAAPAGIAAAMRLGHQLRVIGAIDPSIFDLTIRDVIGFPEGAPSIRIFVFEGRDYSASADGRDFAQLITAGADYLGAAAPRATLGPLARLIAEVDRLEYEQAEHDGRDRLARPPEPPTAPRETDEEIEANEATKRAVAQASSAENARFQPRYVRLPAFPRQAE